MSTWEEAAACDHAAFNEIDTPQRPMEQCPTCELFLRTITTNEGWGEHWAEERADQRTRPYVDPRQDDRIADDYYERRTA